MCETRGTLFYCFVMNLLYASLGTLSNITLALFAFSFLLAIQALMIGLM